MRPLEHRKAARIAGTRIRSVLAAGIALATVAALPPAADAASGPAVDEYVLTPPSAGRQEIPPTQPIRVGEAAPARHGLLASGEQGSGPIGAMINSAGELPPVAVAAAIVALLSLAVALIASRREQEPAS